MALKLCVHTTFDDYDDDDDDDDNADDTIPYRCTKSHILDFVHMGFWVHPTTMVMMMMLVMMMAAVVVIMIRVA